MVLAIELRSQRCHWDPLRMYSAQRCRDQVCWADWNSNCMARMHREAWRRAPFKRWRYVNNIPCVDNQKYSAYIQYPKVQKGTLMCNFGWFCWEACQHHGFHVDNAQVWPFPGLHLADLGGGVSLSFREPGRKQGQISVSIWTSFRLRRLEQVFSNVEHSFFFKGGVPDRSWY